ncbi:hypothetical protein BBJ28_00007897 [Nothophytophthora sp. Chile5]|nr:hypothetical protein BBJ28_00007897 [Nothophytophthora sp. Chile5]
MESEPMPSSSMAVLTSPRRELLAAMRTLDGDALAFLSASSVQVSTTQSGLEQLLALAHDHVDAVMTRHDDDEREAAGSDGEGCVMLPTSLEKPAMTAMVARLVSNALRTLNRNARGNAGGSGASLMLAADVGEARYERLKRGFTRLKQHVVEVKEHRELLHRAFDQVRGSTMILQENCLVLANSDAAASTEVAAGLAESCIAIDEMKVTNVLNHEVATQSSSKMTEFQRFEEKLKAREQLRYLVEAAETQVPKLSVRIREYWWEELLDYRIAQLQDMREAVSTNRTRGRRGKMKRAATTREIAAKRQEIGFMRVFATLVLLLAALHNASRSIVHAEDVVTDSCQSEDVLWIWSGALTSHSVTFKFGLREGHACSDADFILYAFPELQEGERPHSAIGMCSAVDSGERGEGEELSVAALEPPNVKQCELVDVPHSARTYHYELTLLRSGVVAKSGTFRTPVPEGEPFSFRVAFSSCADEDSDPKVFDEIAGHDALFFLHTGDLHYHNLVVNDVAAFRDAYNSMFASPAGRAMLAMQLPFAYMWDDHDFGPDNSDKTAPGRNASVQAYREFVPHYPLPGGVSRSSTVHQAFSVGRVRFIVTDLRSARTPNTAPAAPSKTVLGKKQKAWFKAELLRATSDPNVRLIVWCSTMPWLDDERKWGHFVHEQQELVNFMKAHALNRWVPIVIVSGDAHMLAVDDGSHSPGNLTVLHAAALGRPGSVKGGPYSHGAFPGSGQYGLLDITDEGGEQGRVCIYYRGMNIYKGMLVEYDTCHPDRTPAREPYFPPPVAVRVILRALKKSKKYAGVAVPVLVLAALAVVHLALKRSQRRAVEDKKHS